jgi:hypothetical protein
VDHSDAIRLQALFNSGDLDQLSTDLKPFLQMGDLDARYLACSFSVDLEETGSDFDIRRISELKALADMWHRPSLIDLAWAYRHGDDIDPDIQKFQLFLTAAALLGDQGAAKHLAEFIEAETRQSGLCAILDK